MPSLSSPERICVGPEDYQNGIFVPIPFANVMGMNTAILYFHIRRSLYQNDSWYVVKDRDGRWYKQTVKLIGIETALSYEEFLAAKKRLLQYGLIRTKKSAGFDATTLYQLTECAKHERLSAFVRALYNAMTPDSETKDVWYAFYFQHPEIVDEFKGLVKRFNQYIPPADYA